MYHTSTQERDITVNVHNTFKILKPQRDKDTR